MKYILLFTAVLFSATAFSQLNVSHIKLKPKEAVANSSIKIQYNAANTALKDAGDITVKVISFSAEAEPDIEEYMLNKKGKNFIVEIPVAEKTDLLAMCFLAGDEKDCNGEEGYVIKVKAGKKSSLPNSYLSLYNYHSLYKNYMLDLPANPELALEFAEKAFNENPQGFKEISAYINSINRVKGKNGTEDIKSVLEKVAKAGIQEENTYNLAIAYYNRMGETDAANELKDERNNKFPDGIWAVNEKIQQAIRIEDSGEKEKELLKLLADEKMADSKGRIYPLLLNLYIQNNNQQGIEKIIAEAPIDNLAATYNNVAWGLAEKGENLAVAENISEAATTWAKNNIQNPSGKKPSYNSSKEWEQTRKNIYAMYADTYAFILYKKGDFKKGFEFAKDAAEARKFADSEYNDRYALLLEKTATPDEVKKKIEAIYANGKAGADAKEVLKRAYIAVNKSENGYASYVAELDALAKAKLKEELRSKLIDEPASMFTLVNLQGDQVKLEDYKGKTVILDFWATWCGPCIASFPGMQKAVDKYKDNSRVAFLFIDTWEQPEDREKKVEEFIKKNNYSFHVLYDKPQEDNPDQYQVVSNYKVEGIPTKFIVDKNGRIRFKSVGFGGSTDGLVDELEAMIELVE